MRLEMAIGVSDIFHQSEVGIRLTLVDMVIVRLPVFVLRDGGETEKYKLEKFKNYNTN